jgi:hypothetical protein
MLPANMYSNDIGLSDMLSDNISCDNIILEKEERLEVQVKWNGAKNYLFLHDEQYALKEVLMFRKGICDLANIFEE